MPDAPCLRVADVAARWRVSHGFVRALIGRGDLPCLRLGKLYRIPAVGRALEARDVGG